MSSLLTARRRARPRPRRPVPLRGILATDARFIVGAMGAHSAPDQVAYLSLNPDGSVALVTDDAVPDAFGVPWSFRADGTVLIPVGGAPMELDLRAVRQALAPSMPVSEFLRTRWNRELGSYANDAVTNRASAESLTACAEAALWMQAMAARGAFSTGRPVRFAHQILSRAMVRVPDAVTPSELKVLAAKIEQRYAKAGVRLLGVLPCLQAQV